MHTKDSIQFILASGSMRRQELLSQVALPYKIIIPGIIESCEPTEANESCMQMVKRLSREKAEAVAANINYPAVVIAADTLVAINGRVYGKPADLSEAGEMLSALSGKCHQVYTGVCVKFPLNNITLVEYKTTNVYFRTLPEAMIEEYLQATNPCEYAGAYAIQGLGSLFVERIDGDYYNVVGLPLSLLYDLLREVGYDILSRKWIPVD